jgi:hypothetical protein
LREEGSASVHPFAGAKNLDLQPVDLVRLATLLDKASQSASRLAKSIQDPAAVLGADILVALSSAAALSDTLGRLEGFPAGAADVARAVFAAADLPRVRQTLQAGAGWREARDNAEPTFVEHAFDFSVSSLRAPLVAGASSFFTRWGSDYRGASRQLAGLLRGTLPEPATERVELVDRLAGIATLRERWKSDEQYCAGVLGGAWRGESTEFAGLLAILSWCERVVSAPLSFPRESVDLANVAAC